VAINQSVDVATAQFLADGDFFVEAIVAPGFDPAALEILKTRPRWKKNVRLLQSPLVQADPRRLDVRRVYGGLLLQQPDDLKIDSSAWKTATDHEVDGHLTAELAFAWNMVRFVKSNAIVLSRDQALCGVGAGQMSRVDAVRIAIEKAGGRAAGSVLASDAFFPFADSIEVAAQAGVVAVIQPGGSVRDDEVIAACQQHNLPLVLTGRRHFLH
jgi:phosphoribosylaminoimidazolecarboxamide formyltransferase/IMP cyclohydrolase